MPNDNLNGAKLIIEEMEAELNNKRISRQDRMFMKSTIYQLRLLSSLRSDVETLKSHDVFSWVMTYPKMATIGIVVVVIIGGLIDWGVIRKPLLQGLLKLVSGIDIPVP